MRFDRSTSPARLRARTRAALGQLVGDVLSTRLDALEQRLAQSALLAARPSASAPTGRLREVLDRDRALFAAQPSPAPAEERAAPLPELAARTQESAPLAQATACTLAPEEGAQDVASEPIRTRTMARLLAAQGYRARAIAIYESLLAERPDDAALQAELERLRD